MWSWKCQSHQVQNQRSLEITQVIILTVSAQEKLAISSLVEAKSKTQKTDLNFDAYLRRHASDVDGWIKM